MLFYPAYLLISPYFSTPITCNYFSKVSFILDLVSYQFPLFYLLSAIDGWGFGLDQFVDLYAKKLKVNARVMRKTLWGDFYLNAKTKKIQKGAAMKAKKPLFVQVEKNADFSDFFNHFRSGLKHDSD